ncbi:hypothetical protein EBR21_12620, partial [bacterium]|nr:hypothetical protein [bacterium]
GCSSKSGFETQDAIPKPSMIATPNGPQLKLLKCIEHHQIFDCYSGTLHKKPEQIQNNDKNTTLGSFRRFFFQ